WRGRRARSGRVAVGRYDAETGEVRTVACGVTREEGVALHRRVSADVEVGERRATVPAAATVRAVGLPGQEAGVPRQRLPVVAVRRQRGIELLHGGEADRELGVDD